MSGDGSAPQPVAGPFDQPLAEFLASFTASADAQRRASPGYAALAGNKYLSTTLRAAEHAMTAIALDLAAVLEDEFDLPPLDKDAWSLLLGLPAWRESLQDGFARERSAGCVDRAFAAMEMRLRAGPDDAPAQPEEAPRVPQVGERVRTLAVAGSPQHQGLPGVVAVVFSRKMGEGGMTHGVDLPGAIRVWATVEALVVALNDTLDPAFPAPASVTMVMDCHEGWWERQGEQGWANAIGATRRWEELGEVGPLVVIRLVPSASGHRAPVAPLQVGDILDEDEEATGTQRGMAVFDHEEDEWTLEDAEAEMGWVNPIGERRSWMQMLGFAPLKVSRLADERRI